MDLRFLREFVVLAQTGSYYEAAERLYMTTSSLSRHIVKLEEDVGVPLFDRTTRKVNLNQFGRLLLPYAQEMVRIDDERIAAFEKSFQDAQEKLTIGSIPMMKAYGITALLAAFQKDHQAVDLRIREGDTYALIPMLRNEECDFAFLRDAENTDDLIKIPFAQDHLCLVVSNDHPLAGCSSIPIEMLKDEALLLIGKDAYMYNLCTDMCKAAGFAPKVVFTSHRADNLIDLVARGVGIAMLMKKPASSLISPSVRLIDITPTVNTTIHLAYHKDRKVQGYARQFLKMVKSSIG